jgi:hypothetical protein
LYGANSFRLADEAAEVGKLGSEARLNDPCVNDDDETMKPARSKALYSSVVKTPCDIAEEVPMRFKISRNFSVKRFSSHLLEQLLG